MCCFKWLRNIKKTIHTPVYAAYVQYFTAQQQTGWVFNGRFKYPFLQGLSDEISSLYLGKYLNAFTSITYLVWWETYSNVASSLFSIWVHILILKVYAILSADTVLWLNLVWVWLGSFTAKANVSHSYCHERHFPQRSHNGCSSDRWQTSVQAGVTAWKTFQFYCSSTLMPKVTFQQGALNTHMRSF